MTQPPDDGSPAPLGRRSFVTRAATLAAALVAAPAATANALGRGSVPATGRRATALGRFDFAEATLPDIRDGITSGRWSARAVVEAHLARIRDVDQSGPRINAVLEVNPDALTIADELDRELAMRGPRGPLHGVPVLLKDNFDTADRMHTSAGSLALANHIAARDAHVVAKLRAAGAVILGKTNMGEWANARGRATHSGWSARGKLTRNPYALDRSTGGSSSGSAAAVAASLAPAAIGTETAGSIMTPAALNGIVGLKPTVGLVSRAGIIPVSVTQDTAGPMCRSVRDAAIMLSAMAGPDPRDRATRGVEQWMQPDYTDFLDASGLRGARVGVARHLFGANYGADRVVDEAIAKMREAGAVIVDGVEIGTANAIWGFDAEVLAYELKAALDEYLGQLPRSSPVRSLRDLIRFNAQHADEELRWFGQETFIYAQARGGLASREYQAALQMVRNLSREQGIDATLTRDRLDVIVAPTQSPAWLSDMLLGENAPLSPAVIPAAAGYPCITVPAGDVAGLPVGMMFMATAWSEPQLLRYAYAFEQVVAGRKAPTFVETIEVG